ncbi:hypothetical protein OIU34_17195 [Pararhizobium sp. BT-229]|uniref:hypothetical protein n=1 Tax=Pararhizobium sp. BT-229 TaxID=2986923 RepID=UPI0021F79A5A|nr:hypothetical protein [Pararhizobium sp. BT-229]MCV9963638.1 hypothetical protein [Pararhizobium sp. BT-229]
MENNSRLTAGYITASVAREDDIEFYTTGSCHWLAVAIQRMNGWPMLAVMDYAETYWHDPNDEDASIPSVVHVYAISPDGEAWDVFGRRSLESIREEAEARWTIRSYGHQLIENEDALREFVGCWGTDSEGYEIDRPLPEYTEDDILETIRTLPRIFPDLPMPRDVKPQALRL